MIAAIDLHQLAQALAPVPRLVRDAYPIALRQPDAGIAEPAAQCLGRSGNNRNNPPAPPEGEPSKVSRAPSVEQPRIQEVVIAAKMTQSGAVILNDLAARGWTATLDGAPVRIYRANVLARGVLVPEGSHRIEMKHQLPRLRQGLLLPGCSLLFCAALVLIARRSSETPAGAAAAT